MPYILSTTLARTYTPSVVERLSNWPPHPPNFEPCSFLPAECAITQYLIHAYL